MITMSIMYACLYVYCIVDKVITGLSRHLGMTPTAAMDLATCVDRRVSYTYNT